MNATPPDHPFADGFLSLANRELRSEIHDRYQTRVDLAYRTNRRAVSLQHELVIHHDRLDEALGAALFARTIAFVQSTVLMLEHGMPVQAKTLLRAGLETLFQLAALAMDKNVGPALVASHDADRKTLVDRMRRWGDPSVRTLLHAQLTDADLAAISSATGKPTNIYDLAKLARMEDWYLTVYTLLSFAAHSKIADLDRHIVVDDSGQATEFQNEPDLLNQEQAWSWTTEVQLLAMKSVASIFVIELSELEELRSQLINLAAE